MKMDVAFPLESNLAATLLKINKTRTQAQAAAMYASARIVVHERLKPLLQALELKKKHGSKTEREFYTSQVPNMQTLLARFIAARPLCFYGRFNSTLLRNGATVPSEAWDMVGTESEHPLLTMHKGYMTFDEMALSALIGVSSWTWFINNGNRNNRGVPMPAGEFHPEGVYIGLVGARFEQNDRMESEHFLVRRNLSVAARGYGADASASPRREFLGLFARLYGVGNYFPSFDEVDEQYKKSNGAQDSFFRLNDDVYFHVTAYKQRIALAAEIILLEASARAADQRPHCKAYVFVVGLGLGVWAKSQQQAKWFVDAFMSTVDQLMLTKTTEMRRISDVDFSWIEKTNRIERRSFSNHDHNHQKEREDEIVIRFSQRNPADPFPASTSSAGSSNYHDKETNSSERILVAVYAWDSNSFPGNEYWQGMLTASGDPAAASCSTIGEVQNSLLNPGMLKRVMVLGGSEPTLKD